MGCALVKCRPRNAKLALDSRESAVGPALKMARVAAGGGDATAAERVIFSARAVKVSAQLHLLASVRVCVCVCARPRRVINTC